MSYYLFEGDKSIGPFSAAQLVLRPGFKSETLVFPVGATTPDAWKPATSFPDLARALDPNSSGIFLTAAPPRAEMQPPRPRPRRSRPRHLKPSSLSLSRPSPLPATS